MSAVLQDQKANDILMEVRDLTKYFPITGGLFSRVVGQVKAVDGVSFDLRRGETLGLVGESGCGKTTTGRAVLRLIEPTSGTIKFEGRDITRLGKKEMRALRKEMQIIFQDPFGSLNPRMSVGEIIEEPLVIHHMGNRKEREERVRKLLEVVGLASYHTRRYPHEFSGGQRQRIGIARALALNPKLIVADEPVSALDVSIQSQILNLLEDLQKEFGLTYLFIAHGLNVIRHISDRVGVMYLGAMVEIATSEEIYHKPLHPYTEALFSAIPIPNPDIKRERIILQGDVPSPVNPPSGCRFHTRCPIAQEKCKVDRPILKESAPDHWVACHYR
ncbi:ABC transporter ATP-binding protein [Sulfobacillus thermosulfidooxidans]|uniref:Dipeptide ABC transporter ATP-binding protein n=1 Tax=Sulfobacillus thermosulfidooxidans TaxID=28034 RepID=A0A1R0IPS2_SULTH|nr:dipeptide ABC transporter ATP-binding protein [Sulfobacillus thermosulfidooxidans]OLZ09961.1 peptide ABC transporter substrate-binding protein [Sulfobacillus thermosulfidooxidans]OLZ15734.1 peptide ABC transporter substrate-binding protein [Sulfobacillus thermosulfidooxidans]OLZ18419.1 peptide ABC transporter substrate-binding protein [Sulfobacillus thermosulfidooxidans]PSR28228.1 MAG: dipeptide ABC transporter ATP-binding protein [Sulfobacillus thermosulfidooxidans]